MKNSYLVTFSSGDLNLAKEFLISELSDIEFEVEVDRVIVFNTSKSINNLSDNKIINNIFVLIKRFDNLTGYYFKPIFQWAGRHDFIEIRELNKRLGFKTFRAILMDRNKVISGHRRAIKALENQISNQSDLRIDRVSPDTEVWIYHTKEGYGFILFKISKN